MNLRPSSTAEPSSSLFARAKPTPAGYRDIDIASVARAASRGGIDSKIRFVDVREPAELEGELGRIDGVENVPLASLGSASYSWSDKDQEIVIICRSGGRSSRAAAQLAASGFRRVMNMVGGMLAWNDAPCLSVRR